MGEEIDWKEIGNRAFQDRKFEEAVKAYTAGLKETPSDVSLLSNRSINYLCLELFSLALADAEAVLKMEPKHVKGIYRKVKALIGERKYTLALEFILKENYKDLLNSYTPEKNLGEKLLDQTMELVNQEAQGTYNMAKILTERTFEHEIADFNVLIGIDIFKGRGRGLVVKEKIEAGQLVIGSKAYAFIVERKHREMKTDIPSQDTQPPAEEGLKEEENYFVDKADAKASLIKAITEKIKKYPEQTQVMYNLHAGRKFGHLELDESLSISDMERISKIVDCNALSTDGRMTYETKELMYGLWLLPSYINHSCSDGNVKWNMHGDFLCIRAIKDIEPGEELLMAYVSPGESLETRRNSLAPYEVICTCRLCQLQRSESPEARAEVSRALKRYDVLISARGAMVSTETSDLESIVTQLEEVHPQSLHRFCPFLLEPYRLLARKYFRKEEYEKSLNVLEKGYELVIGTDFTDILITFTTNIISSYLKNRNKAKAIEWVKTLKSNIKMCYGEPVDDVLKVIAPDLMMKLKKEKIPFC